MANMAKDICLGETEIRWHGNIIKERHKPGVTVVVVVLLLERDEVKPLPTPHGGSHRLLNRANIQQHTQKMACTLQVNETFVGCFSKESEKKTWPNKASQGII